ncbi:unnamed protein product [Lymnaea stagnalis]|uniref:DNA polymerase eta n=1 Tax=Lymnaea stagnalis TaxID=6523 RepID=A0AAV2H1Q2_LYMST
MTDREIVLIDMDCFYVQVEQRLNPSLKGKPCAVVQYKTWKGGGIIAVGYEARACGVTRQMRGDDAKAKCPEIHLARVPEVRGKADLTRYREAGAEVIAIFSKFCTCVERASIDEAYLDVTAEVTQRLKVMEDSEVNEMQIPNTFVEGYEGPEGRSQWLQKVYSCKEVILCEHRLAVAAGLVEEMRAAVLKETGFTCSAGIAHNKMLAKLACGRNKPNKQTVLPHSSVQFVFSALPLQKIRHLGGKLGASLLDLGLKYMADLTKFTEHDLQKQCGSKTGSWLYNACRGIDSEPVSMRELPKSIGCSKIFSGKQALDTKEKVTFWLGELAKEVSERLNKDKELNKRTAKSLTVSVSTQNATGFKYTSNSRACALVRYDAEKIAADAFALVQQFRLSPGHSPEWAPAFSYLGLSASRFTPEDNTKISTMFASSLGQNPNLSTFDVPGIDNADDLPSQSIFSHEGKKRNTISETPLKYSSLNETEATSNNSFCIAKSKVSNDILKNKGAKQIETFFSQMKKNSNLSETPPKVMKEVISPESDMQAQDSPKGFFAKKMKAIKNSKGKKTSSNTDDIVTGSQVTSDDSASCSKLNQKKLNFKSKAPSGNTALHGGEVDLLSVHVAEPAIILEMTSTSSGQHGSTDQTSTSSTSSEDFTTCSKCGEVVSMWELPEHNDFHFAMDLQTESNKSSVCAGNINGRTNQITKRKNKSPIKGAKKKKQTIDKNIQPLTVFFSKT